MADYRESREIHEKSVLSQELKNIIIQWNYKATRTLFDGMIVGDAVGRRGGFEKNDIVIFADIFNF